MFERAIVIAVAAAITYLLGQPDQQQHQKHIAKGREATMYRDIQGELVDRTETSRHHVFARSLTKGGSARKFMNQHPLTPRMLNIYHYPGTPEGLHQNVPLLRPPKEFTVHCLNRVIRNLDSPGQYDQLVEFADRVDEMSISHANSDVRRECGRITENLQLQLPYILRGQVEVVYGS